MSSPDALGPNRITLNEISHPACRAVHTVSYGPDREAMILRELDIPGVRATVLLRFDYSGPDEPADRLRVYAEDFSGAGDVHFSQISNGHRVIFQPQKNQAARASV